MGAIDEAIYNDAPYPDELDEFIYRREFGLSAQEMVEEPVDQFFTNLYILAQIKRKRRIIAKHG